MGWEDYHLHSFTIGSERYGKRMPELEMQDEKKVKLYQVMMDEKQRFRYEYDFGDGWLHIIQVEKILEPEPDTLYPRCITGKRACPPEDVGGIGGYFYLLEALENPKAPEYAELLEWLGDEYDPDTFDVVSVNQQLEKLSKRPSPRVKKKNQ